MFFSLLISISVFSQAGGSITGTVYFAGDNSVMHNATVKISELKLTAVTDDYGKFEFKSVPPGRYTLIAHQDGFGDSSQRITVTAGAATTQDFQLAISGVKEQVTISATGSEQLLSESIASVNEVDSSQITARAAVGLGDVLQDEPGIAKRSGGAGNTRPVIRGFDGDRVKVTTDGVSSGSLASQSGDHAEPIDIFGAERIEIVKGPATLLYGSNAIGGVVNSISGHEEGSHPGLRGFVSAIRASNNDQAAVGTGIEYGVGPWMFWGNASGQRTGDYTAGGNFGKVANSFTRNAAGSLGGGYYGKKAYLTGTYNYYQSRYGIPLDFREADPENRNIRLWRNDEKLNFGYNDPDLAITGIKLTFDVSNYRHQEISNGNVGTTFHNNVISYRGMFEQKKFGDLTGRFGFDGYHRYFSTVGDEQLIVGPVKQDNFALFGLEEYKLEHVNLQFGARIENNRLNPDNPALLDRSFTGFSGAAGAKFNLWKGGAFVANYSHSYRAPAIEELYNNGPHDGTLLFEVGNPNLKPEISDGLDLSLRQQNKRFKAEGNFYYYHFNNFVFLAPTGQFDEDSGFEVADYLQASSRFWGTELTLDYMLNKHLNLLGGFDYVNAALADGTPLPRISPARGRLGFDAHWGNFSVKPEFVLVGRQDRVFTNETPTAGYGTFNISGNYVLSNKHYAQIFSVNAFNLNNKLYYNHISFIKDISPEIGRGVRFSYTIRYF